MSEVKHTLFAYDTCLCGDCVRIREQRQHKEADRYREQVMEAKYGRNWKNILSGMGDQ